ncbi:hypothetical protein BRC76_08420 [Halobacteriales archaeon QH_8_67_36]|nr:MAG: hypothetical protein BRC76_08420 [Halobacteriales archaeon QH_8_67_36]
MTAPVGIVTFPARPVFARSYRNGGYASPVGVSNDWGTVAGSSSELHPVMPVTWARKPHGASRDVSVPTWAE